MGIRSTVFFGAYCLTWQFSVGALQAQPVVMGYSGTGVSGTLRRVIEKEKLWQKRGLDVKAIYFGSGGVMSQAMVAGDILLSDSDVPAQLVPKVAGIMEVRVIAVTINRLEHFLGVRNAIKTAEDLKGKRVAISRFGSASDITAKLALLSRLPPETPQALYITFTLPSAAAITMG